MYNCKILIVLVFPLFGFTCVSKKMRSSFIEVYNQLPANVYCVPSFEYPETSLTFTNKEKILANDNIYYVNSLGVKKLFYLDLCKKETWQRLISADTLQVFVFDEQKIKECRWDDIMKGKIYLKRLVYSYGDIVNNGCKITVK